MIALENTPLWPAGHLPLKGEDQPGVSSCLEGTIPCSENIAEFSTGAKVTPLVISPLEAEMAGRPEGRAARHRQLPKKGDHP